MLRMCWSWFSSHLLPLNKQRCNWSFYNCYGKLSENFQELWMLLKSGGIFIQHRWYHVAIDAYGNLGRPTGNMQGYCFICVSFSNNFPHPCYSKKKKLKMIYCLSLYTLYKLKSPIALYFAWSWVCRTEMRPEEVWKY